MLRLREFCQGGKQGGCLQCSLAKRNCPEVLQLKWLLLLCSLRSNQSLCCSRGPQLHLLHWQLPDVSVLLPPHCMPTPRRRADERWQAHFGDECAAGIRHAYGYAHAHASTAGGGHLRAVDHGLTHTPIGGALAGSGVGAGNGGGAQSRPALGFLDMHSRPTLGVSHCKAEYGGDDRGRAGRGPYEGIAAQVSSGYQPLDPSTAFPQHMPCHGGRCWDAESRCHRAGANSALRVHQCQWSTCVQRVAPRHFAGWWCNTIPLALADTTRYMRGIVLSRIQQDSPWGTSRSSMMRMLGTGPSIQAMGQGGRAPRIQAMCWLIVIHWI